MLEIKRFRLYIHEDRDGIFVGRLINIEDYSLEMIPAKCHPIG